MASIYKRKRRNGKRAKTYTIKYKDEHGRWVTAKGFSDRELTQKKAAQLEYEVECRRRGLVDPFEAPRKESLAKHLAAYERHLEGKGNTEKYVDQTLSRIQAIVDGCRFIKIEDLTAYYAADRVSNYLQKRRSAKELSAHTSNHYLTAVKGFCKWAAENDRMPPSPIGRLKKISTEDDEPYMRRAATEEEFARVIVATRKGPAVYRLTGEHRAWLYMLAAYSGLRAQELADLRPSDFRLKADPPHILVRESTSKNGKEAKQPLREDFAEMLSGWLPKFDRSEPIWPGCWWNKAAKMLRKDLASANVEAETDEGILDFHSLRVTFITALARGGVHPRIAQTLARHSKIDLTMRVYTKLTPSEHAQALAALPSLPA